MSLQGYYWLYLTDYYKRKISSEINWQVYEHKRKKIRTRDFSPCNIKFQTAKNEITKTE